MNTSTIAVVGSVRHGELDIAEASNALFNGMNRLQSYIPEPRCRFLTDGRPGLGRLVEQYVTTGPYPRETVKLNKFAGTADDPWPTYTRWYTALQDVDGLLVLRAPVEESNAPTLAGERADVDYGVQQPFMNRRSSRTAVLEEQCEAEGLVIHETPRSERKSDEPYLDSVVLAAMALHVPVVQLYLGLDETMTPTLGIAEARNPAWRSFDASEATFYGTPLGGWPDYTEPLMRTEAQQARYDGWKKSESRKRIAVAKRTGSVSKKQAMFQAAAEWDRVAKEEGMI